MSRAEVGLSSAEMSDELGLVFDRVAEDYDRVRPVYPKELVDAACEIGGLAPGSHVVEVGCGTGKLTRVLDEREFRVEAIDPGRELVRVARRHLGRSSVNFHVSRFEDLDLPPGAFAAVFSATAFHWVEPAVGWSKVARLLAPGGVLVLLTHPVELDPGMLAAWRQVSPDAARWVTRDVQTLLEGAEARLDNISELWAWLVKRNIARPEAATLFREVRLQTVQVERAETAAEAVAHTRTQSEYLRLGAERRLQLEKLITATIEDSGGSYRPYAVCALATARRA
jgi:ubiquinone/menaquinone biosynthesis C-methylase UbiE